MSAPLDWEVAFSIPWTRENHRKHMFPANEVLTAFLLGWRRLQKLDTEIIKEAFTLMDPEIMEEAFTFGIFLNPGAAEFEESPSNTGFYSDCFYRIRVGRFHTVNNGVTIDGFAHPGGVIGTSFSAFTKYRGEMIPFAHKNELYPHGYGIETYLDKSVYSGQFWCGCRQGYGSLRDEHGAMIYMGEWSDNPDGSGIISVGNGVYHQGKFESGNPVGSFLDLFDGFTVLPKRSSRQLNGFGRFDYFEPRMTGVAIKLIGQKLFSLSREVL